MQLEPGEICYADKKPHVTNDYFRAIWYYFHLEYGS